MRLANITWPRAQKYFEENDMVIVSIGSIECHGRHMPLGTDTLIPDRLLELIEEKSDVLIAPTIPYGACECLEPHPGTINLGTELLYNLLYKVVENLYNHGARKILVLNGHGGNIKTIERVGLDFEKKGALAVMLNWWLMLTASTTNSGTPRHSITPKKLHKENSQITGIFICLFRFVRCRRTTP